ncbi:MAG: hypothetical protein LBH85_01040 [Treponema sp.]|jgi:hypothetical protein|nr:hypothetical protein [Treponema sp.]
MKGKIYRVQLTKEEEKRLKDIVSKGAQAGAVFPPVHDVYEEVFPLPLSASPDTVLVA